MSQAAAVWLAVGINAYNVKIKSYSRWLLRDVFIKNFHHLLETLKCAYFKCYAI